MPRPPCAMVRWSLLVLVLLLLPCTAGPARAADADDAATAVIARTNALRAGSGLARLQANDALMRTARDFATYMSRTGRYGHEADGRTPDARAKAHGYEACIVDENIGWIERAAPQSPHALADAFAGGWENSPPHRRNMLDPDVTETGVAIERHESTGRWYAVQMVGRPRSGGISFSVTDAGTSVARYRLGARAYSLEPGVTRTHEICRPAPLGPYAGANGHAQAVMPANGAHYTLVQQPGGWRLQRQ
jgi:cysteine-rich secretory family protein